MIRAAYRVGCRQARCRNWPAPARRISYAADFFAHRIFQPGFEARQRFIKWQLDLRGIQAACVTMCKRDIRRATRPDGKRKSDKPRAKRIERGRFGIERG